MPSPIHNVQQVAHSVEQSFNNARNHNAVLTPAEQCEKLLAPIQALDLSVFESSAHEIREQDLSQTGINKRAIEAFKSSELFGPFKEKTIQLVAELKNALPNIPNRRTYEAYFDLLLGRLHLIENTDQLDILGEHLRLMYETGCMQLHQINTLIQHARTHLKTPKATDACNTVLTNLAEGVAVCGPGSIKNIHDQLQSLKIQLFPPDFASKLKATRQQIATQEILQFVKNNYMHENNSDGWEIHYVAAWNNMWSAHYGLEPQDDPYVTTVDTRSLQQRGELFSQLGKALSVGNLLKHMAEEYIALVRADVRANPETEQELFFEQIKIAQESIEQTFGRIDQSALIVFNNDFTQPAITQNPSLVALGLLKQLNHTDYTPSQIEPSVQLLLNTEAGIRKIETLRLNQLCWIEKTYIGNQRTAANVTLGELPEQWLKTAFDPAKSSSELEHNIELLIQAFQNSTPAERERLASRPAFVHCNLHRLAQLNEHHFRNRDETFAAIAIASIITPRKESFLFAVKARSRSHHVEEIYKALFMTNIGDAFSAGVLTNFLDVGGGATERIRLPGGEQTFIQWACESGSTHLFNAAIKCGNQNEHKLRSELCSINRLKKQGHADPTLHRDLETNTETIVSRDGEATLLEWMCHMNREDMWKIVLQKFPHILDKENYDGTQLHPLCISLQYNRPDIANLLIDHIPANQINHQSWPEKKSALHYASRCTTPVLLEKLIENNADVNAIDVELITPLHVAARMGRTESCIALLNAGANNKPAYGIYPADLSYNENHLATTLEILERTQSINKLHHKGKSFAHKAAANIEQIEFLVQLVSKGANINLRSSMATKGKTPLHEAARAGNVRMVEKLIELGADTKKRDYAGRTALDFAIGNQDAALVALLTPQ